MMRHLRNWVFLVCILSALSHADKKEDWLPIGPQELQIKDVPGDPGAPAIQIYYAQYIDNSDRSQFVHRCIKILNETGKKYADVEIVTGPGAGVKDLKARTIHPDGSIVEFTGKPFDKTLFKSRGIKVLAKTFTFPDATVGSIIEYKYT